jgi:iron(II)-dependent oxidoreductase
VGDGIVAELVIHHEQQHNETMLQTLALAHLDGFAVRRQDTGQEFEPAPVRSPTGLEMVEIPGGTCTIGAPAQGFAYDNERPRHRTDVRDYLIGRTPSPTPPT